MKLRPNLGVSVENLYEIRYPVLGSYKLDGIRALWDAPEFFSRTLKTVPSRFAQQMMAATGLPPGLDGELIAGEPNAKDVFRRTTSVVMSMGAVDREIRYFVFDRWDLGKLPYAERIQRIVEAPPFVIRLDQHWLHTPAEVEDLWLKAVTSGYEGLILRNPHAPYKYGRSTLKEQGLVKVKRFQDAEAEVIGFEELLHNANEAERDERGYAKRSSHQENKVPMGILGALVCSYRGAEFRIGTGFTAADRAEIWHHQEKYLGALAKFKYLNVGIKDLPRHPVWLGWRSREDL